MDKDNKRSHQDKAHGDDENEERLNPGMNSEGAGGAGADRTKPHDWSLWNFCRLSLESCLKG